MLVLAIAVAVYRLFLPDLWPVAYAPTVSEPVGDREIKTPPPPLNISGEWNTYHGDHTLTGVAEGGIQDILTVSWHAVTGAPVEQPPVISGGRIFTVTARPEVFAFGLDGQLIWRRELVPDTAAENAPKTLYVDAPIAAVDGMVIVATDSGLVVALSADTGVEIWRALLEGPVHGTPNYYPGAGVLYVLEQETGALACLEAGTGRQRWRSTAVDRADGSPGTAAGIAVYGSCASALHLIATDKGEKIGDIAIEGGGGQVAGGVAVHGDFAYLGCRDGRVMRANLKEASLVWLQSISESEVFSTPAVKDGWVVVTSLDGVLHALDRETGAVRWKHELGGEPASPVIAGDKVVVTSDDTVFLVRLADGSRVWEMRMAGFISAPAVIENLVVVGCEDGTLIALGPMAPGEQSSPAS